MTTYQIKQIAQQIDVSPADALDLVRSAGVRDFWHEGKRFSDQRDLLDYLLGHWQWDATPELEFSATPAQMAAILVSEIEQVLSDDCVALSNANGPDDPNVRRSRGLLRMLAAA